MRRRLWASILLASFCVGCASAPLISPPSTAPTPSTVEEIPNLELRALLLLLGDRRLYEPATIRGALEADPETRRRLALTLGRLGDPRGMPMLEALLIDESPLVRRTAVFSLGLLPFDDLPEDRADAARLALDMVGASDRKTGELAVEALARLGVALPGVAARLSQETPDELLPRLLPSLFRFREGASAEDEEAIRRLAEQGLEQSEPALRAWAAYALCRDDPPEEALPTCRRLLADPDPSIRVSAARALGFGDGGRGGQNGDDLSRLRPLLDDLAAETTIEALRSARRLLVRGKVAPSDDWRPRLLELLADPRSGVRTTAIETSASWLLDDELSERLTALLRDGEPRERELALLALLEGGDPRAPTQIAAAASDPEPVLRAAAVAAADLLGEIDLVRRAAEDPSPRVRVAALQALLASDDAVEAARRALRDEDLSVRAVALRRLRSKPWFDQAVLLDALRAGARDRTPAARIAAIEALVARAQAQPAERDAIVRTLEQLVVHEERVLRRAAAASLVDLGEEPVAIGSEASRRTIDVWRDIVVQTAVSPRLEVTTDRGSFEVELACSEAPLHCLNFLQLSRQGFYDGVVFYRIDPGGTIRSGDPRGDGWGGPGYTLRDEGNLLRFERGVLGMVRDAPDTAGSRFFIALAPQPRLDGAYTAFGRVVSGRDVLDRLVQGDRILKIRER